MKLNIILSSLLFATAALVGCESVDEADRWTPETPVEMKKNVLIEDFTGQNCKNCPTAAELIATLRASSMGQHIIAVGIHGGSLSIPAEKQATGLALPQGEDYNKHWGVESWPAGLIDRGTYDGQDFKVGKPGEYTGWTTAIVNRIKQELLVDMAISAHYDADTRQADITVNMHNTQATDPLTGTKVTVWLTESDIPGPQIMPDGKTQPIYMHQHVFRESFSDPYGDAVQLTTAEGAKDYAPWHKTVTIPTSYRTTGKPLTKPENMAIVAFVTAADGQVLQVVERELIEE